ncbi:MAG TPA: MarR family transcriptional regulator [Burkholderiaceae bacterium]|nr:MarR family transcriptional regulator [Burkholderiaceae bacterium]
MPSTDRTAAKPATPRPAAFYRARGYGAEQSVGYLMRQVVTSLARGIDQRLEPVGLTNAQWVPLLKLHLGAAANVAELARECQIDAGAMTRLLDRLEAKRLVRRVRSTDDRRVVKIELTAEGVQAARRIPGVLCEVQNAHLAGFTAAEWETLKAALQRMLANGRALDKSARG